MPLPTVQTLQFDVVTDAVGPDVTLTRYGDGSVEFVNKDGIVRRAHSDELLVGELFALIDGILNP